MIPLSEKLFRELRNEWFEANMYRYSPERIWEDDNEIEARQSSNEKLRKEFDKQTDELLRGEYRCIAPTCAYDMTQGLT